MISAKTVTMGTVESTDIVFCVCNILMKTDFAGDFAQELVASLTNANRIPVN